MVQVCRDSVFHKRLKPPLKHLTVDEKHTIKKQNKTIICTETLDNDIGIYFQLPVR